VLTAGEEDTIGGNAVKVRVKIEVRPRGVHAEDCARNGAFIGGGLLIELFQALPSAAVQVAEEFLVVSEV
jgi:hypothetical protein